MDIINELIDTVNHLDGKINFIKKHNYDIVHVKLKDLYFEKTFFVSNILSYFDIISDITKVNELMIIHNSKITDFYNRGINYVS